MVLYRCGLKPERAGEFSTSSNTHESDFKNNQIHRVKMRFSQSAGRKLLEQWRDIFSCAGYCVFVCASAGRGGSLTGGWVTSVSCSPGDIFQNILPTSARADLSQIQHSIVYSSSSVVLRSVLPRTGDALKQTLNH